MLNYGDQILIDPSQPIKLRSARAWRTYLGGKLLNQLVGRPDTTDDHFPEEWIISVVSARNAGRKPIKDEGMSKLELADAEITLKEVIDRNPVDFLGSKHAARFQNQTGVLVKLIDAAERLTIQVHPDKFAARKLFDSEFGKTECWHILGGRTVNGNPPCIYLGFRQGVTRVQWEELFRAQDYQGMLNCMHRYAVGSGETYLIEGGIPHAIGAGCFLVEIQEPTDYTIRVEQTTPSGFQVDDFMCHQGLGFDKMFDCFTYGGFTKEETYEKWNIKPVLLQQSAGGKEVELVGYQDTPCFKMNFLEVNDVMQTDNHDVFSGLFALAGAATITVNGMQQTIKQGEQYFVPAKVRELTLRNAGQETFKAVRCFGPDLGAPVHR